jgi:hypothetical protein
MVSCCSCRFVDVVASLNPYNFVSVRGMKLFSVHGAFTFRSRHEAISPFEVLSKV